MEKLIENLATFGLGGLMAGAFVYVVRHLLTVHIPQLLEAFAQSNRLEREQNERHFSLVAERLGVVATRLAELEKEIYSRLPAPGDPPRRRGEEGN